MKRMINKAAIAKTNYNSAYVAVLTYHALQIKDEGAYLGHIMQGKRIVKTISITCSQKVEAYQINLDFGMLKVEKNQPCKSQEMMVRPEGYIILMNSAGDSNLHFELEKVDKKPSKAIYKTTSAMRAGDVYACTFLRPGLYNLTTNDKQTTALKVLYPDGKLSKEKAQEPVRVKIGGKYTKEIQALPMQGVVFEFETEGRLEIKLIEGEKDRGLVKSQVQRYKASKKKKAAEPKKYQWRNPKHAGRN